MTRRSAGKAPGRLRSAAEVGVRLRRKVGSVAFKTGLNGVSRLARLHPQANPKRHQIEVVRNVPYIDDGSAFHRLDIYRPLNRRGPRPAVLYVHGGAFRILSKESHWMMGLAFARAGFTVFNANYRLAPRDRYPAAIADVCAAAAWVTRHARSYGADPDRLVFAGESAGGNLVTALALGCSYRRPEPYARSVFDLGVRPRAVVAACAVLQVSDMERLVRRKPDIHPLLADRIVETSAGYLPDRTLPPEELTFADPLVFFERRRPPDRPIPPFFAFAGTRDPILDDTRRLKAALDALGAHCEARIYPGEVHAFHAMLWRKEARACWRDQLEFLRPYVKRTDGV